MSEPDTAAGEPLDRPRPGPWALWSTEVYGHLRRLGERWARGGERAWYPPTGLVADLDFLRHPEDGDVDAWVHDLLRLTRALRRAVLGPLPRRTLAAALGDVLDRLARADEEHVSIAELVILGAFRLEEVAGVLGRRADAVTAQWWFVRAWLHRELADREPGARATRRAEDPHRHHQLALRFLIAEEIPTEERTVFLEEACRGDAAMRADLAALLRWDRWSAFDSPLIEALRASWSGLVARPDAGSNRVA